MKLSEQIDNAGMIQLVEAGPFSSAQEIADFLDCEECGLAPHSNSCERALIIEAKRTSGIAATVSSWATFLAVLNVVLTVAGAVTGIAGAVTSVYSVAKL